MYQILDEIAQENDWDDWHDLLYNCEFRSTIDSVLDEAIDRFRVLN